MNSEINHELGILTNDGWVITIVTDKSVTLGDAIIKTVIVQPREDCAKRLANEPDTPRTTYKLNTRGEVIYERFGDKHA